MTISADNFAIYIALLAAAVSCVAYFVLGLTKNRPEILARLARGAYIASVISTAYASVYLLEQILSMKRYDIAYIHDYSGPADALIYRLSSFWAGQEGSMLLWALLAGVIGLFFLRRAKSDAPQLMSFWSSILTFFLVLLVAADPFRIMPNYEPGMVGEGLNALLNNPWMAIHPPVVFLGYALLMVPAAFAVHAIIKRDNSTWAAQCLPWALFGWVSLSAGLLLGMIWSYEVLGWGGFWGWDPVENASFVPWLTGTALVHGFLMHRNRGKMARANLILAFGTFLLIIYATFLTRSGVLSGVSNHSFADLGTHGYLLACLIFYVVLCLGLLVWRWRGMRDEPRQESLSVEDSSDVDSDRILSLSKDAEDNGSPLKPSSKDFMLIAGVVVVCLFAVVVVVGTSFPLFTESNLSPTFYTHMSVPIAIATMVLIALATMMNWGGKQRSRSAAGVIRLLWIVVVVAVGIGLATVMSKTASDLMDRLLPSAAAGSWMAVQVLVLLIGAAIIAFAVSAARCAKTAPVRAGAHIAHAGAAFLILGIIFSSSGGSTPLSLPMNGAPRNAYGYGLTYKGTVISKDDKQVMKIEIQRGGRWSETPLTIQSDRRGSVSTPFIRSSLFGDLYISPAAVQGTTITPTASIDSGEWIGLPVTIPGTGAYVMLKGMQVEARSADLDYTTPNGDTRRLTVSEVAPVSVDGVTLAFQRFVTNGGEGQMGTAVGVDLMVTGPGVVEKAIIEVSTKPLIWLVWLGGVLIIVGGLVAIRRRTLESRA